MSKIDAYLSKQWNRCVTAKVIIFISKIAGAYMFLYILGMGGYYENGGTLTHGDAIKTFVFIVLLVAIVTLEEHVDNYRELCAIRYKWASAVKRKMLESQEEA